MIDLAEKEGKDNLYHHEFVADGPTAARQRYVVLDALRGLALLGIALANYPEFALWTFLSPSEQSNMPTDGIDRVVRFLQYMFVDGKFYTIFSLLFGIGFALFLSRHATRLFIRRMIILVAIGFLHLMFVWSGDILLLYAIGGLLLTLFIHLSDKALACIAACLIFCPVALDAVTEFGGVDFARPFYDAWWRQATANGINEENFASWLRNAESYPDMFAFLVQGAYERIWEFVSGHRLPKVLGLFIIGYLMGKRQLYTRLSTLSLPTLLRALILPSLCLSLLYAWSAVDDHPWGLTVHSLLYALSVIPMAFCYIIACCLAYQRCQRAKAFQLFAATGRMALTNYLCQSFIGVFLFYGIGLGLGTSLGLVQIEVVAVAVFLFQMIASHLWLRHFRFGPFEWLWRMLTYGHFYPLRKNKNVE